MQDNSQHAAAFCRLTDHESPITDPPQDGLIRSRPALSPSPLGLCDLCRGCPSSLHSPCPPLDGLAVARRITDHVPHLSSYRSRITNHRSHFPCILRPLRPTIQQHVRAGTPPGGLHLLAKAFGVGRMVRRPSDREIASQFNELLWPFTVLPRSPSCHAGASAKEEAWAKAADLRPPNFLAFPLGAGKESESFFPPTAHGNHPETGKRRAARLLRSRRESHARCGPGATLWCDDGQSQQGGEAQSSPIPRRFHVPTHRQRDGKFDIPIWKNQKAEAGGAIDLTPSPSKA